MTKFPDMRIVALSDGVPVELHPRLEAMFLLVIEHHAKEISGARQGWLELHWDGKKVHSRVKRQGGVRVIDVRETNHNRT